MAAAAVAARLAAEEAAEAERARALEEAAVAAVARRMQAVQDLAEAKRGEEEVRAAFLAAIALEEETDWSRELQAGSLERMGANIRAAVTARAMAVAALAAVDDPEQPSVLPWRPPAAAMGMAQGSINDLPAGRADREQLNAPLLGGDGGSSDGRLKESAPSGCRRFAAVVFVVLVAAGVLLAIAVARGRWPWHPAPGHRVLPRCDLQCQTKALLRFKVRDSSQHSISAQTLSRLSRICLLARVAVGRRRPRATATGSTRRGLPGPTRAAARAGSA